MPSELCPALSCLGLEYGRRTTATNMDGYNDPAAVVNPGTHLLTYAPQAKLLFVLGLVSALV